MGSVRLRVAVLVAALMILSASLTGCGLVGGTSAGGGASDGGVRTDDGVQKSRERVQAYLDAMKAKNLDAGRSQLCTPMHDAFDQGATGPNGDFADHFTVSAATITDVRANGNSQEVSTSITVAPAPRTGPTSILFTVVPNAGEWCIAKEAPGGNTPSTAATP
jgi:hypothetical protein